MIELAEGLKLLEAGSNLDYYYGPYVLPGSVFPETIDLDSNVTRCYYKKDGTLTSEDSAKTLSTQLSSGTHPENHVGQTIGIILKIENHPEICEYWNNGGEFVKKQPKIDLPDSVEFYNSGSEPHPNEIDISEDTQELQKKAVTPAFLANWDGCYYDETPGKSNLSACNRGAFGDVVTHNLGTIKTLDNIRATSSDNKDVVTEGNLGQILPSLYRRQDMANPITGNARDLNGWDTDNACVTPAALAHWSGGYIPETGSAAASNLKYCSKGTFGTSVTKNVGSAKTLVGLKNLDDSDDNLVTQGNLKQILPSNFATQPDAYKKGDMADIVVGGTPKHLYNWEHDDVYVTPNALAHWSGAVKMPDGTIVSNLRYCNIGSGTTALTFKEGAVTEVLKKDGVNADGDYKGQIVSDDWGKLLTAGAVVHWDGRYYNGSIVGSSLAYCNYGGGAVGRFQNGAVTTIPNNSASWHRGLFVSPSGSALTIEPQLWSGQAFTNDTFTLLGARDKGAIGVPETSSSDHSGNICMWANNIEFYSLNSAQAPTKQGNLSIASDGITYNKKVTAASFYEPSDARLKDIQASNLTLDQIISIPLVNFTWKDKRDLKHHLGTIAQDVQEVAPEIVEEGTDGMLTVEYDKLGVLAIEAVRQLKDIVDKQVQLIESLQQQINELKK